MPVLVRPPVESAHWYSPNGEPVHTRPTSEGGLRPTSLRDARHLGLFPSVTGILKILSRPGLEKWKINQVLLAMKRTPQAKAEADEVYYDRVVNEAFDQVDKAGAAGGGLHGAIMAALQGRTFEAHFKPYIDKIFSYFERAGIEPCMTEQTLVNHEFGFAGTMDLAARKEKIFPMVIDWKTRRTKPGVAITSYEGQPMQMAAYGATYWKHEWSSGVYGMNVYISSTEPGRIEAIPYSPKRMRDEFEAFKACCDLWRHLNGYDPRVAGSAAESTGTAIQDEKEHRIVVSAADPEMATLLSLLPQPGAAPAPRTTKEKAPKPDGVPDPSPTKETVSAPQGDPSAPVEAPTPPETPKKTTKAKETKAERLAREEKEWIESKQPDAANEPPAKAKPRSKVKEEPTRTKPELPTMPIGKNKGKELHNMETIDLEKAVTFSLKQLQPYPEVLGHIKRILEARGSKAAAKYLAGVKAS